MILNGKAAVVTGGARGIGFAIARRLLQRGVRLSLWDVDRQALDRAQQELQELGSVDLIHCDVRDQSAVEQGIQETISRLGKIDMVINNAGYMAPGFFLEQPVERWNDTLDINMRGILHTVHAVLPHMYARGNGHIVNLSSAAGLVGVPGLAAYSASKWGVYGLTEALREEAWASGYPAVRYSSIHPMFLKTGMFEGARLGGVGALLFPRVESHDVIAKAVVEEALVKGRRCVKRPRSLRLVLLLRGLLPDSWFARLGRVMKLHTSMASWQGRSSGEDAA